MKRFLSVVAILVGFAFAPPDSWSGPDLLDEPPLSMNMSWNAAPNGMIFMGYDTDHNGKMDLHTLRVVETSGFSKESVADFASHFPRNHIFFTKHGNAHFYYVTVPKPVFYALDLDEDGEWDLMYKDSEEDGVNGNEVFYDSPSGDFSEPPLSVQAGTVAMHEPVRK